MQHIFKGLTAFIVGLSLTGTVHAAGYQLNEYSATGMGRSFAGMGVVGDDFSAIGYNPAGMSLNKTSGAQLTSSVIHLYSRFKGLSNQSDPSTSGRGHTNIYRLLPGAFTQYKMNEDLTLGIGAYTPYGLATDYPNGWFAESHGGLSEITAVDVSPALSYRINNYLTAGAAINLQYTKAHLTSSASDIGGDDLGVGYSVGLMVKPLESLRFGLSYRSKITHNLKGDVDRLTLPGLGDFTGKVDAKITTPETAILSGAWDVNDKWTLSGTARWTRWKRFSILDINLHTNAPGPYANLTSSTQEKWRNTGFYALGADYHANQNWTVRAGIGYDMTVIRSAGHRTARIPDGRRVWNSVGASYTYQNLQFDVGYSHIFVFGGHARGADNLNPKPNIKYSSNADMLSLGIQYKF